MTCHPKRAFVTCSALGVAMAGPATASAAGDAGMRPVIDAITCRTQCQAIDAGVPGSVVQVSGPNVGAVDRVVLLGHPGPRDDVSVPAVSVSPVAATITIPAGARTGPVRAYTTKGVASARSSRRVMIGRRGGKLRRGPLLQARADVRRITGDVAPSVSFFVRSRHPQDVAVDVLRNGQPVAHWDVAGVPGGSVTSVTWTVRDQAEGRYTWRVWPKSDADAAAALLPSRAGGGLAAPSSTASAAQNVRGPSFYVVRHVFPIAGRHSYGMGAGRFGAGRPGHIHQGQDVFARCGTPLVAVSSGTIKYAGFEALAGNYLVLQADDGFDYAYMHLKQPALVKKGAAVTAGQHVGDVGDTGDAQGCHLHFEVWPAPGWQAGGSPVDPLPILKGWDV